MAAADRAWLSMDTPANRVVIHVAMVFDSPLSVPAASELLQRGLQPYRAFTHRVEQRLFSARWVEDAQFSMARHLEEVWLPAGSGRAELKRWMASQAPLPLPTDRPLWQARLVQGVAGGSALVLRIHHALADGVSTMALIQRMTDLAAGERPTAPAQPAVHEDLCWPVVTRRLPQVLADMARMLFMRRDAASVLKGDPGVEKSVAWSEPLSLALARDLAHRHDATVNDVMLAVIADVLRTEMMWRGHTPQRPIRTVVPMNLRPHEEALQLGNRFGLVGLDMPVHLGEPLQRLTAVRDRMRALKRGLQGPWALALVRMAGCLPDWLQKPMLRIFSRRCTLIVTNVIGPAETRSVGGARMAELMLCVPQGLSVGIGVSIISYQGELRVGFLTDRKLMPDAAGAAASVRERFERLRRAVCHAPAPETAGEEASEGGGGFWHPAAELDREALAP
jgi:WS/DGAT/MGAT family acyltransferase